MIGKRKYDKKAFKIVLKKLGLNPNETVFIDDTEINIRNARNLGMNAIQFKNNAQLVRDLRKLKIRI